MAAGPVFLDALPRSLPSRPFSPAVTLGRVHHRDLGHSLATLSHRPLPSTDNSSDRRQGEPLNCKELTDPASCRPCSFAVQCVHGWASGQTCRHSLTRSTRDSEALHCSFYKTLADHLLPETTFHGASGNHNGSKHARAIYRQSS